MSNTTENATVESTSTTENAPIVAAVDPSTLGGDVESTIENVAAPAAVQAASSTTDPSVSDPKPVYEVWPETLDLPTDVPRSKSCAIAWRNRAVVKVMREGEADWVGMPGQKAVKEYLILACNAVLGKRPARDGSMAYPGIAHMPAEIAAAFKFDSSTIVDGSIKRPPMTTDEAKAALAAGKAGVDILSAAEVAKIAAEAKAAKDAEKAKKKAEKDAAKAPKTVKLPAAGETEAAAEAKAAVEDLPPIVPADKPWSSRKDMPLLGVVTDDEYAAHVEFAAQSGNTSKKPKHEWAMDPKRDDGKQVCRVCQRVKGERRA